MKKGKYFKTIKINMNQNFHIQYNVQTSLLKKCIQYGVANRILLLQIRIYRQCSVIHTAIMLIARA